MKIDLSRCGFFLPRHRPDRASGRERAGRFKLAALLGFAECRRLLPDNVYFSRPLYNQPRRGDWVTDIRPEIGYGYVFVNGRVNLGVSAEIGRHATYSTENYADFNAYANGQYRFNPTTLGVWGVSFGRDHEPRSSIDPQDQLDPTPTQYWKATAYGAISHRFGDNTLKLGVTYDGYNFLNQTGINNDDRDRDMGTIGARFTHKLTDRQSLFAETTLDVRRYHSAVDDNGYARNSQGVRADAGWQANVGEHGRVEIYGGLLYQDYSDARFAAVVAPDFGGRYTWASGGTSITADLRRSLEETTLGGISSYLNTRASLQFSQDLSNHVRLYGGASFADLDFQDSSRRDQLTNFWLGGRKYLTPHFYIGAEAGFEERESTSPVNDYTETRIMARLGIDTRPAFNSDDTGSMDGPSGFYVGAGGDISSGHHDGWATAGHERQPDHGFRRLRARWAGHRGLGQGYRQRLSGRRRRLRHVRGPLGSLAPARRAGVLGRREELHWHLVPRGAAPHGRFAGLWSRGRPFHPVRHGLCHRERFRQLFQQADRVRIWNRRQHAAHAEPRPVDGIYAGAVSRLPGRCWPQHA